MNRRTISSAADRRAVRAVIDFGTGGTRAAIVRVTSAGVQVLGVGEAPARGGIARPGHVMRREEISTLAEAALSAAEQDTTTVALHPTIADQAIVGLTGPLLHAHPATHHAARDPEAPLYAAELQNTLDAAQQRSLQALSHELQNAPIRRSLVGTQLVGAWMVQSDASTAQRLTELPQSVPGRSGDTLSVVLCNMSWPTQGLEVLRDVLAELDLALCGVVPQAQAVARVLPRPNAVLLDVGAEHTEIALVEAGALSDLTTISLGGHFFTEMLARLLQLSPEQAERVKQQAAQRTTPAGSPVGAALRTAVARWRAEVERALRRLAVEGSLPPLIYLFGGGAQLPLLFDGLRAYPWQDRLGFERHPDVQRLTPYQLHAVRDPRGLLYSSGMVGLAALAAWAGRNPSPLQQHLDRTTSHLLSGLPLA